MTQVNEMVKRPTLPIDRFNREELIDRGKMLGFHDREAWADKVIAARCGVDRREEARRLFGGQP